MPLPLAFSTLGCPEWSWREIVDNAVKMGFQGIEVRGVAEKLEVLEADPFLPQNRERTKKELADRGLAICCLGSSVRFDDARRFEEHIEAGKAYIDLAHELGVPYVRVFGDRIPSPELEREITERVVRGLDILGGYASGKDVTVLIESHGDFSVSQRLRGVMEKVQSDAVGVLWDLHHPWRFHGERLEETCDALGPWVRHVHFKDSVRQDQGYRYTLVGQGEFPVAEAIALLKQKGYDGWISLEWEKRWHPELEPPEAAFPEFVKALAPYL